MGRPSGPLVGRPQQRPPPGGAGVSGPVPGRRPAPLPRQAPPAGAAGAAGGWQTRGIEKLIDPDFYARETLTVARELLGKLLIREIGGRRLSGRLVELEAYLGPEDLAAHSARGLTPRTSTMYGPPGHAYVYLIYGMWNCLNFVTRPAGEPQAILVRALEPGPQVGRCSGPGLLCRSLEIDRTLNGAPLRPPDLYVVDDGFKPAAIHRAPRIGVDYAGAWKDRPWRFCLDSPHLSRPVPAGLPG